jgi:putative redox protein
MTKIISKVEAKNSRAALAVDLTAGKFTARVDEPVEVGGTDSAPAPADYICMALASCTAITLRMYANRKSWIIGEINVAVSLTKQEESSAAVNTFYSEIRIEGPVSEEQKKRLFEIAKVCPVHRLLSKPSEMVVVMAD